MKEAICFIVILFILSCEKKPTNLYEVEIDYNLFGKYSPRNNKCISSDSLYIFYETNFDNDTINIYVGNETCSSPNIHTDFRLGFADYHCFALEKLKHSLGIQLNDGKIAHVSIDSLKSNRLAVLYHQNVLEIRVLNYTPSYE